MTIEMSNDERRAEKTTLLPKKRAFGLFPILFLFLIMFTYLAGVNK